MIRRVCPSPPSFTPLAQSESEGSVFCEGPEPPPLDPRLPQNRSPRPRGLPIPNVSTGKPSGVQTASYPHPNHIVVKSDELTLMESHSCTKPRGRGSKNENPPKVRCLDSGGVGKTPGAGDTRPAGPACPELRREPRGERKRRKRPLEVQRPLAASHSLATRSGALDSYTFALLYLVSRSESTLPESHESVSKQRTLTSLESTLTSSHTSHSKQRTLSPFRMNTYTISRCNSSRMNTSKKGGEGVGVDQSVNRHRLSQANGLARPRTLVLLQLSHSRSSPHVHPCFILVRYEIEPVHRSDSVRPFLSPFPCYFFASLLASGDRYGSLHRKV
jgi:hypothetical protein